MPSSTLTRLALTAALVCSAGPARAARNTIYVQPLGRALPDADVALVKLALERFYGLTVTILPRASLPKRAYYPPRRRYRAEKLLDFLGQRLPKNGKRILGLTGADISTTKGKYRDWGVLGLANLDGSACVISSFRARKKSRSRLHARQRLAKVAVHEIGHTLGLDHCPTVGCLMEDARGKVATCDREHDICPRCRAELKRRGYRIVAKPAIPWPKPR